MSRTRGPVLWVIDPSVGHPEDQGVEQVLVGWPGESRVFHPSLRGDGPSPADGYRADGVVLLGSRASVHDDLPWLSALGDWLRPIVQGERPVALLGICFGHQLVAHLAGAEVGFRLQDRSKLVGIEESVLSGGRLLPGQASLRVVVSHCEEVKTVPAGYRVTARRPHSAIDGLEHESRPIFSFQFHPEAREDFMRSAGIDPPRVDARLVADSQRLLGAFRELVRKG